MDGSPPGSSVHGISQARVPEWVAISLFRGSSVPRDQTCVSCIAGGFFTTSPTWEVSAQLENILDNKIQKDKKKKKKAPNPTDTSEEPRAKTGCQEQNRVLRMSLAIKTTRGGQTNEVIPLAQPLNTPLPSPHVRNRLTHTSASKQGKLTCSRSPLLQQ